jgi:thymidine kinase
MAATSHPANPIFRSPGERAVYEALLPQLSDDDVIFANLEISDPVEGDVEIDLAVLLKNHGLVVVEVKGAHITHNGQDWIQSGPSGSHVITPAAQAKRNMYALRDFIERKWSLGKMRCAWAVAFPHCDITDPKDPALPIGKIVQKSQLSFTLSQLKNVVNAERDISLPAYDGWIDVAVKNLLPAVVHKTNPEAILGNNYEFIRSLTHERDVIIDQLSENLRYYVKGPAGSGKTWLAFEQAKRWSADGKKVAIVTYNRGLTSYMHIKNNELADESKVNFVGTFHDFASYIGSTAGSPLNYDVEQDPYRDDLLAKAAALNDSKRFDAFVIDEAQDFMPSWWQTLELALLDSAKGQMALFGDDQQQVFGDRPAPSGNYAHFRLNENLRNSQQIAKAVAQLIDRPAIAKGPHSFEIEYVLADSEEEVFEVADDQVERLVDVENWGPREIALLTTQHRHPEHANRADKDRNDHWRSLWEDDEVFYCTVGGFKGLERPVVVLAVDNFHNEVDPQDVLYVGMSRARDKLVIVATAQVMDMVKGLGRQEQ